MKIFKYIKNIKLQMLFMIFFFRKFQYKKGRIKPLIWNPEKWFYKVYNIKLEIVDRKKLGETWPHLTSMGKINYGENKGLSREMYSATKVGIYKEVLNYELYWWKNPFYDYNKR